MKLTKLNKLFAKPKKPGTKLQARTAARRQARTAARASGEASMDDEPNVSLSGAFIVVLILHVVAIGGIFAFTKARQQPPAKPRAAASAPAAPAAPAQAAALPAREPAAPAKAPAPAAEAARTVPAAPPAPPATAASATGVKDSGATYTVAKGDNPVSIAKKLKVSSADLVLLNGIDDPRRIQIGQKLKVPAARE